MEDLFWLRKGNQVLGALLVGMTSFSGALFLIDLRVVRHAAGSEREWAVLLLAVMSSLLLAGAPAGWLAGKKFEYSPSFLWLAMAGAYLVPVISWFVGLELAWPASWLTGLVLALAGGWAGYGLALLLAVARGRAGKVPPKHIR